jgi:hypothetical protein
MKIFTARINSFLVHEKIRTAFAFTSRCFKRYQRLFMLQTTTISYVFWWLKSLLTAYLPIWVRKTVDNPPAQLSAVLRDFKNLHCRWWWCWRKKLWAKRFGAGSRWGLLGRSSDRGLWASLAEVRPFIGASVCLRAGEPGRGSLLRTERGLMARLFSKNCVLVLVNPALGSTPAPSAGGDLFLRTACGGLLTVLWSLRDFGSNGGYVFILYTVWNRYGKSDKQ